MYHPQRPIKFEFTNDGSPLSGISVGSLRMIHFTTPFLGN